MSNIINGLGGYVCQRNGDILDYSWREAVQSLLNVCEQVVICDSDSTDGTSEAIVRWAEKEPRIKVVNIPWTDPTNQSHRHWVWWLNEARKALDTPYQITLDADEVLDDRPECIAAIKEAVSQGKCLRVNRLNFFRDPQTLLPFDKVIGKWVVRVGLQSYEMPSDQPVHENEYMIVDKAVEDPPVKIFHLGFLREKSAFYRKHKAVMKIWTGASDIRILQAEQEQKGYGEMDHEWLSEVQPYTDNYYPESVHKWLNARGHRTI